MKELLSKLINNYVVIGFKSGDKIENAFIKAIIGNVLVVSSNGSIAAIEIPHIAYVKTEGEAVEAIQGILTNEENKDDKNDKNSSSNKDNKKDDKKKKHHHH